MKDLFKLYPEIVFIDGTYSVNKLRMPMYSFIIEDGNGCGQAIGYAFVANERTSTLETVLGELAKAHDFSKVKVVIVDKALNEIAAIKSLMPDVTIQLCKFHVMQAFTREIKKTPVDESTRNLLVKLVREMVFARTEEMFQNKFGSFAKVSTPALLNYFHKNWGKNKEYWAGYLTNSVVNLGNTTNNRIESHNQKIKDVLNRNKTLAEAVRGLLLLHKTKTYASNHEDFNQTMKVSYRLGDDDKVADTITKTLTPYAARIAIEELKMGRMNCDKFFKVTGCNCTLSTTMGLPCRHKFASRIRANSEISLFCKEDAAERWHIGHFKLLRNKRKVHELNVEESEGSIVSPLLKQRRFSEKPQVEPKSKAEKFRDAMMTFKAVADYLSFLGSKEFLEKMGAIEHIYSIWLDGNEAVINTLDQSHEPESTQGVENPEQSEDSNADVSFQNLNFQDSQHDCGNETPTAVLSSPNLASDSSQQDTGKPHDSIPNPADIPDQADIQESKPAKENVSFHFDLRNLQLPKTPPARGRSKFRNTCLKNKRNKSVNVFASRQRSTGKPTSGPEQLSVPLHELDELEKSNHMLTDKDIFAASCLLKKAFPGISGLEDTVLGSKLQFSVARGDFVQVLHDGNLHWLAVTNIGSTGQNEVLVFDSLHNTLGDASKLQIASLLMTDRKDIRCYFPDYQKQKGGIDCGLFAIAAATSLCYGQQPQGNYEQHKMRSHLVSCLKEGKMKPFPTSNAITRPIKRNKTVSVINVYCVCRLPDNGEERMMECGQCREWFHQTCMSIKTSVFLDKDASDAWKCQKCSS